jgi:hypothetical protein
MSYFKFDGRDVYLWSNLSGLFLSDEKKSRKGKWKRSHIGNVVVVYLIDHMLRSQGHRDNIYIYKWSVDFKVFLYIGKHKSISCYD